MIFGSVAPVETTRQMGNGSQSLAFIANKIFIQKVKYFN